MANRVFLLLSALLSVAFLGRVEAECANACNGHGKCTSYDMCICHRNWQANDCSERVCMHGLAHVDTPKGDLDGSGAVIAPSTGVVVDNSFQYPYGTTEQFPQMEDTDLNELENSAHYYMECSNKGICDRSTGTCDCFDGYDGVACQRASCPGYPASCSGHGVCKTAAQLAAADGHNVYKLWNKDSTMGCECDPGYYGADCSQRKCKVGVDPLYLDDTSTVKYSIFDLAVLTTGSDKALFDDGTPAGGAGQFAIRFYDHSGEDWVTEPLDAGADCNAVITALENLPNDVIPAGETVCVRTDKNAATDNAFVGNDAAPGSAQGASTSADYRITYRMSIWDAYVYKSYGAAYQDVLSVKTKLGNQVYSPLMWIPGSTTLPYADDVHAKTLSTGALTIASATGQVITTAVPGSTLTAIDVLALKQYRLVEITGSGGTCAMAGVYSLSADAVETTTTTAVTATTNVAVDLTLAETLPSTTDTNCVVDIVDFALLGSANPMLSPSGFTGNTNNEYVLTDHAATVSVLTLSSATELLTDADLKLLNNRNDLVVSIQDKDGAAAGTCDISGNTYRVSSATQGDGATTAAFITLMEPIGTAITDDECSVKLVSGTTNAYPSAATRVTLSGYIYRLKFFGNPGYLKQPEIVTHLDGKRNSLMYTSYSTSTGEPDQNELVITKTWTDGQQGEDKDYFADHCDGVTVSISITNAHEDPNVLSAASGLSSYTASQVYADANYYLRAQWTLSMDAAETALLKKCLGDADLTTTNNVEIYNWDYGSADYPHLIKLVRTVTTYTDGGYYVAIYWDSTNSVFKMVNPFTPPDALLTDVYEVYTTKGTLARVSAKAQAYFGFGQKNVITTTASSAGNEGSFDGDISCEVGDNNGYRMILPDDANAADRLDSNSVPFISDLDTTVEGTSVTPTNSYVKACLNKTDIVTFLNWDLPAINSPKINLYTVKRLVKDKVNWDTSLKYGVDGSQAPGSGFQAGHTQISGEDMTFGTNVIELDMATNWAVELANIDSTTIAGSAAVNEVYVYKFIPHVDSTYEYVAECSNRGLCDSETGTCECFAGYTDDACQLQSSLSL